jgi:hypothetical protein
MLQVAGKVVRRHGRTETMTLEQVAASFKRDSFLKLRFDTFGNDL